MDQNSVLIRNLTWRVCLKHTNHPSYVTHKAMLNSVFWSLSFSNFAAYTLTKVKYLVWSGLLRWIHVRGAILTNRDDPWSNLSLSVLKSGFILFILSFNFSLLLLFMVERDLVREAHFFRIHACMLWIETAFIFVALRIIIDVMDVLWDLGNEWHSLKKNLFSVGCSI